MSWNGSLLVKTSDIYPNGVGPRCLKVSPDDRWLVIYNKGENSIQRVALNLLPVSGPFEHVATEWLDLGFDPTPGDRHIGRREPQHPMLAPFLGRTGVAQRALVAANLLEDSLCRLATTRRLVSDRFVPSRAFQNPDLLT